LKHAPFVFVFFAFFLVGCAHRPAAVTSHASAGGALQHNPKTIPKTLQQTPSGSKEVEAEFLDDKLDFLDEEEDPSQILDPIAPWNRAMYHFNDKFYFWILKPLARGYRAVVPKPIRISVTNFFHNLTTPIRMVNSTLQGKWKAAGSEFARFMINSTAGILGLGDPAQGSPWSKASDEDLGQTLATYGIGNGFYIVWPFLGPSTLRDTLGMFGDQFLNPVSYVESAKASLAITGLETVNKTSFRIGDYESLKDAAIEPYEALRDAYIQHRNKKVNE